MFEHELDTIVLRRVLALRGFAMFDGVDLDELTTLAQNVDEIELAAGEVVAVAGARATAVHFVLEGSIAADGATWGPGDVFGALDVFANHRARGARAGGRTRTLRLDADDLVDILDDNFGVLLATLRTVARLAVARSAVQLGAAFVPIGEPLGLVERVLLLRRQPTFATARVRALTALAHTSNETSWAAGTTIARIGELPTGAHAIARGTVRLIGEDGDRTVLRPGDVFGLVETLAARPHTFTLEAVEPVRALATSPAVLYDVIEEHTDLGLSMLATLSRALIGQRSE